MSEYTPITGELRAAMRQWGWVESGGSITFATSPLPPSIDVEQSLAISGSDFDRYCDAIDSIHTQLERENADLRVKFVNVNRHAQHMERENESLKAELELDRVLWEQNNGATMPLPLDVDGVPINIGDVMVYADGNTCPLPVVALVPPAVFLTDEGPRYADMCRHAPDTWESIIYDAMQVGRTDVTVDVTPLIERCKALCERTKGGDAE